MGMVVVASPAWGKAKCPGCRELGEASLAPNPHLMCSWGWITQCASDFQLALYANVNEGDNKSNVW